MAASGGRLACRQLFRILSFVRNQRRCLHCSVRGDQASTTDSPSVTSPGPPTKLVASSEKAQKISNAMKSYLEQAMKYEKKKEKLTQEYELGRRHLANMMGISPEHFTKQHVNLAIQYLMPSGLFDKKARPHLLEADDVLPHKKPAQFGRDGRPYHHLFYTTKPNYYQLLHDIVQKIQKMNKSDRTETVMEIDYSASEWINNDTLEKITMEPVGQLEYESFIMMMEKLKNHPKAEQEEEFVMRFRKLLKSAVTIQHQTPSVDDQGRLYYSAQGKRKKSQAFVKVILNGTGKVEVNGRDILYFPDITHRAQVMMPIQVCGLLDCIDVVATTEGDGHTAQSGAIRLAISKALATYVDEKTKSRLIIAGLLTQDPRRRERDKPGQEGARRKYTWRKR